MAYEINRRNEADYRWFRFEAPTELLEQLDHNLKIADGVLRFRIFKVDPSSPVIVPPAVGAPGPPRERSAHASRDELAATPRGVRRLAPRARSLREFRGDEGGARAASPLRLLI